MLSIAVAATVGLFKHSKILFSAILRLIYYKMAFKKEEKPPVKYFAFRKHMTHRTKQNRQANGKTGNVLC